MSNIYQIQEELLSIFDELEECGGELTPELQEKLTITQEEFKDKIESYTNLIKSLDNDMSAIEVEQKRLKDLYEKKEKTCDKLKEIVVSAINEFGETKKTGVKYIDYGTGYVSIKRTVAVDVNETLVKNAGLCLYDVISYNENINQLDCYDHIDLEEIVKKYNQDEDNDITVTDIKPIDVNLGLTISMADLENPEIYRVLVNIAKLHKWKLTTSVSKTAIKPSLEENGSCLPNLAKLKENKSLIIK